LQQSHAKVWLEDASRRHKDAKVSASKACDQIHDQTSFIQVAQEKHLNPNFGEGFY
jgi:hypothetical protein